MAQMTIKSIEGESTKPQAGLSFRLFSESAKNLMAKPEVRKYRPGFSVVAKTVSNLLKAKHSDDKKVFATRELKTLERIIEDSLLVLSTLKNNLSDAQKKNSSRVSYSRIKISKAESYDAVFSAHLTKRAMQALVEYDEISVLLYQLFSTGCINQSERTRYRKTASKAINTVCSEAGLSNKRLNNLLPSTIETAK
jgi:hypothetical protein